MREFIEGSGVLDDEVLFVEVGADGGVDEIADGSSGDGGGR